MFLRVVLWFLFRELLYCVCASKCDAYACVLEEVGQFSYPWAVVCEYCPFFGFVYVPIDVSYWVCQKLHLVGYIKEFIC